jgi:hypothetical protein
VENKLSEEDRLSMCLIKERAQHLALQQQMLQLNSAMQQAGMSKLVQEQAVLSKRLAETYGLKQADEVRDDGTIVRAPVAAPE